MLAAYSVARVVPSLARVLTPAFAGLSSSATVALTRPPARSDRPPPRGEYRESRDGERPRTRYSENHSRDRTRTRDNQNDNRDRTSTRDRDNRGRATAPAAQTTSRRLAAVPRAPRLLPPAPSSAVRAKAARTTAAAHAAHAASPLTHARGHENVALAQPRAFNAFELHEGLQAALNERFPGGQSTPIQSLALAKLLAAPHKLRAVLGAETGSGKTLAYLLPLLHHLKATDTGPSPQTQADVLAKPRALVLAPTHELTRQSTRVAKELAHSAKLRILGASSPGTLFGHADVLFATGRGATSLLGLPFEEKEKERPGRPRAEKPERTFEERLDLGAVEWLVIDEADVLLGLDFITETSRVVERVRAASPNLHVLLVTATLPPSLLRVLEGPLFGGQFEHLLSPGLHRLPRKLDTRFVPWSGGGNRTADIVHEIKRGFAEDSHDARLAGVDTRPRAVVFCGSVGQVKAISTALEDKGVPALSWTGESPERVPGHNGPLDAFLAHGSDGDARGARVLVTTSLLSRGLDFSAAVTSIYLVDPPRDVLDFVHRAGRAGRAGRHGRVVVFGVNGANDLRYGKEIKSVLGKVERRAAVKPGGRTFSGKGDDRKRR